jgi:SagB-type dehydrogenase family enzyme
MALKVFISMILLLLFLPACPAADSVTTGSSLMPSSSPSGPAQTLKLPEPRLTSAVSLEESLANRRSIREYSDQSLKLEEVSQLLWAAQGITADFGGRTAPSAGALYPLEIYLIAGQVNNLSSGVYKYQPDGHALIVVKNKDIREELAAAALSQAPVKDGAVDLVISAVYERTTGKYGDRGIRYVQIEVGHAAQNVVLQATALGLGAVTIGAFDDVRVKTLLALPDEESPLYIIPIGHKRGG